jgi:single-strand DNA-binding protein
MKSKNLVILVGHTGDVPRITNFDGGGKAANFALATNTSWKDKESGEEKESTEWHNIAFYEGFAKVCEQYVKKGSRIYVEGRLKTRPYEKDGQTHYITEIIGTDLILLDKADHKSVPAAAPQ